MGDGIKLAATLAPEHAAMIDNLKDQLLIVFLKRLAELGHSLTFPVGEIDDTSQDLLSFAVDPTTREFRFTLGRKQ
jgi:hypothetical protein